MCEFWLQNKKEMQMLNPSTHVHMQIDLLFISYEGGEMAFERRGHLKKNRRGVSIFINCISHIVNFHSLLLAGGVHANAHLLLLLF